MRPKSSAEKPLITKPTNDHPLFLVTSFRTRRALCSWLRIPPPDIRTRYQDLRLVKPYAFFWKHKALLHFENGDRIDVPSANMHDHDSHNRHHTIDHNQDDSTVEEMPLSESSQGSSDSSATSKGPPLPVSFHPQMNGNKKTNGADDSIWSVHPSVWAKHQQGVQDEDDLNTIVMKEMISASEDPKEHIHSVAVHEPELLGYADIENEEILHSFVESSANQLDLPKAKRRKQWRPYFTYSMTIVHIIFLALEISKNGGFEPLKVNPWGGPSTQVMLDMGAKYGPYMLPPKEETYRYISPLLLHVGIVHLFFNTIFQLTITKELEKRYGVFRVLPIFVIAGIGGNLASVIFLPNQIQVGASGSLYGLMSCMLIDLIRNWKLFKKYKINPWKYLFQIIAQILVSFAMGLLPGVDNFAHLGGFITGMLAGLIFLPHIQLRKKGAFLQVLVAFLSAIAIMAYFYFGLKMFYDGYNMEERCKWCAELSCISSVFDC